MSTTLKISQFCAIIFNRHTKHCPIARGRENKCSQPSLSVSLARYSNHHLTLTQSAPNPHVTLTQSFAQSSPGSSPDLGPNPHLILTQTSLNPHLTSSAPSPHLILTSSSLWSFLGANGEHPANAFGKLRTNRSWSCKTSLGFDRLCCSTLFTASNSESKSVPVSCVCGYSSRAIGTPLHIGRKLDPFHGHLFRHNYNS
eukprot:COSAG06_NODE_1282_length_10016_cov_230.231118_4_plen_199_part_00